MANYKPPTSLTAQKILAAVREAHPEWLTHVQIAERMGLKELNGYALSRLELLIHRGLIKTRKVSQRGKRPRSEYQAVVED